MEVRSRNRAFESRTDSAKKLKERMPMPMSALVQEVSKVELKPKQQYLTFEICCNDTETDDDVEVPYVRYKFRNF